MATDLVPLPEISRLSPRCIRILGGNPGKFALQGTNTYLLGTGAQRLLIDTGEGKPSWIAAIKKTLEEEHATISSAIITHWHHDHLGGIGQLLETWPGTKIYKSQKREGPGQLDIVDGQKFEVEGATLTTYHTPGHTVDHMVLILSEEDAMFTGDNVLGQGTAVFEDLGTYLDSLSNMKHLFKGRAYPGHGPVIDDGPGKIAEYIQHRQQREEQVIQTLREENTGSETEDKISWTPMELVRVIYRDIRESLYPAAANGVLQILQKLQKEGKVVLHGDRWRLSDRSAL
ncbi:metallo-beta-lactamase superfamily protein [Cercophora newfieldiana]|uniref:Metallo-beta-lactamase superfamily protein n=1 Tax=Cercophora newfieldiana TaxID=92897 RepID=A0AA39YBY4_9PEZI|nr:metallo-beta-lactamase superfamily protein [Cercophora newfieldiana]